MNIVVISGSTRPERRSHQVAVEAANRLKSKEDLKVSFLDIKNFNFPNLDYTFSKHPDPAEEMKTFSHIISESDGIVIVSPEHNGSYSGALKNTLDYFLGEFSKKVMGVLFLFLQESLAG